MILGSWVEVCGPQALFPHHEISVGIFLCISHLGHLGLLSFPTCSLVQVYQHSFGHVEDGLRLISAGLTSTPQEWALWLRVSHHGHCPSHPSHLSNGERDRRTCSEAPLSRHPFPGLGRHMGKSVGRAKGAGDRTGRVPAGPTHLFCIQTYQAYNYCDYSYKPHI